jgi:hypothetical protein
LNRKQLEKDMREYCSLNEISDVAGFMTQCMLTGFNIIKYGSSPVDNVKRESGEVSSLPPSNRTASRKKQDEVKQEVISVEEKKATVDKPETENKDTKKEVNRKVPKIKIIKK